MILACKNTNISAMAKQSSKSSILVIGVLLLLLVLFRGFRSCIMPADHSKTSQAKEQSITKGDQRSAWRRRSLVYTRHARCRMECRNISESEVAAIQKYGSINYGKSDLHDSPCATYAAEGFTSDKQHVRIVFGACEKITTVITCIDLEVEHGCDCK